jgi:hypothetical protein
MVNMFVTWTAWSGYRSRRTGGPPTEPNVNLSHSVADILQSHVTFQLESIDRMYLNVYVPSLQYAGGVVKFFHGHRRQPIASAALMSPMTKSFVAATERFAEEHQIPLIPFEKGPSQGRMTYDLRRLRLHGMIARIPKTHRYRVTPFGLRAALFFTRAHARLYRPSVTQFSAKAPPLNSRLALQFQKLENTIHTYVREANLAA